MVCKWRESIAEATANGNYLSKVEACATISGFFKTTQEYDYAFFYANRGLRAANPIAYGLGIYKNSRLQAEDYEQLNRKQALHYRKIYDSVNEGIYGTKKVQDLGRVLLNLCNNTFYATNQKQKYMSGREPYVPAVTAVTKKLSDKIKIHIWDNGNSISQKIIDKTLQPFFTTKPTGQVTKLGLSLAYDIVKAPGG